VSDVAAAVLTVPTFDGSEDVCTAALAYAPAGWYVGPLAADTKHPGSILGDGWPSKTSRDPQVIVGWFAGAMAGVGVFLHAGRSGAVVFDLDEPAAVPDVLRQAIRQCRPPFQQTRPDDNPARGHAVFRQPPGRSFGNGTGRLGSGWGEVRGGNGVIAAYPTPHRDGGCYRWAAGGVVPLLPGTVEARLDDAGPAADAATDDELRAFLDAHIGATKPSLLVAVLDRFAVDLAAGKARHDAAVSAACWAMREAAAGYYPALDAAQRLRAAYADARASDRDGGRAGCEPDQAHGEFLGVLAWAVAQAGAADPADTRDAVDARTDPFGLRGNGEAAGEDRADAAVSTWAAVDLTAPMEPPAPPRWLTRVAHHQTPAVALIYPNHVHWVSGEPESGKTWLALKAAAEALALGDRVAFVDFEDNRATFTHRLGALGVDVAAEQRADRLRYVRPRDPLTGSEANAAALAALVEWRPALVVIDGVTEAMTLENLDPSNNAEVARWLTLLGAVLADAGAAVVCIDQVAKSKETRGRWAIGGQHKLAAVTGASFIVECTKRWGRALVNDEETGTLVVKLAKDRPGLLQSRANVDHVITEVTVTAYRSGDINLDLRAPGVTPFDELADRIGEYLAIYDGASKRTLREQGGSEAVDRVLTRLVRDGYVTVVPAGQTHRHHLTEAGRQRWPLTRTPV
jgi:hypothetical protein